MWTKAKKNHGSDLQTVLCLLKILVQWKTNNITGVSLASPAPCACVCITARLICLPLMWWCDKSMTEQQEENKILKCCFSKCLSVIPEHLPNQNGTWSENRKLHKQHSSKTNVPCYLLTATSEFELGNACLFPLKGLEASSWENLAFYFHAKQQGVEEEIGCCTGPHLVTRSRLQHPLIALHMQAWKDSHKARPSL